MDDGSLKNLMESLGALKTAPPAAPRFKVGWAFKINARARQALEKVSWFSIDAGPGKMECNATSFRMVL